MRVADACGALCWRPRSLPPLPKRVLCIRLERLGDAALLVPALQRARQAWPGAHLTWMVLRSYAEFATALGAADFIWAVPSKPAAIWAALWARRRFDLAIEFHGDPRTILLARLLARRTAGNGARGGGFWLDLDAALHPGATTGTRCRRLVELAAGRPLPPLPPVPRLYADPGAVAAGSRLRHGLPSRSIILHIGSGQPAKFWPLASWHELVQGLLRWGWPILVTGGANDRRAGQTLQPGCPGGERVRCLAGETSWPVLTALVAGAAAVVAGDTGIIHLAYALGTPSLALFGPTDPLQWGYSEPGHRSLVHRLECSHCNRGRCPRVPATAISPCLAAITPDEVLNAVLALLAQPSAQPKPGGRGLQVSLAAADAGSCPVDPAAPWSAPLLQPAARTSFSP